MDGQWVTLREASRRLGVSVDSIRKRVYRGTMPHRKAEDGRVYVQLGEWSSEVDRLHTPAWRVDRPTTPASSSVVVDTARVQLESIRDEWLQPLVDQLKAQAETIGQLRERVAQLQAQVDQPAPTRRAWWRRKAT